MDWKAKMAARKQGISAKVQPASHDFLMHVESSPQASKNFQPSHAVQVGS